MDQNGYILLPHLIVAFCNDAAIIYMFVNSLVPCKQLWMIDDTWCVTYIDSYEGIHFFLVIALYISLSTLVRRIQRWESWVQECDVHGLGCWWPRETQTSLEALLQQHWWTCTLLLLSLFFINLHVWHMLFSYLVMIFSVYNTLLLPTLRSFYILNWPWSKVYSIMRLLADIRGRFFGPREAWESKARISGSFLFILDFSEDISWIVT